MLYVTPDRYRAAGTGVDLSGKTNSELYSTLQAASQAVNAAVGAPNGYSFLGGTVTGEEHQWRVASRAPKATDGRLWPFMRPVLAASGLQINVTKNQYLTFTDEQLFVQHDLGYVEPVAAPASMALYTSLPPFLLTSAIAYLDYTYGWNIPVTDEVMHAESGGSLRGGHQFWLTEEDVVLKLNGVIVDGDDYAVDYEEGVIVPDTEPEDGDVFKASYHHKLPDGIAAATTLIATDMNGAAGIAASGMLGLSGIKVEEVELRQSSKVNFFVQPINAAAKIYLAPYAAMFTSMR